MMDMTKAIEIARDEFIEANGRDMAKGDEITLVFNNCVMVLGISCEDGAIDVRYTGCKPVIIDADVDVYNEPGFIEQ